MDAPPVASPAVPARSRWAVPAVCGALALLVLGPALAPGYVLTHDMVFVPRLPLTPQLLGVSSAAPRAVPSDAVVALLSLVLPGQVVQKLVLLAILALAGLGAARSVPAGSWGQVAAAVLYVWNPYVAERLGIGQWAVLLGYASLPWVARTAWTAGRGGGWRGLAIAAGLGSLGGAPAWVMALLVAVPAYALAQWGSGLRRGWLWLLGLLTALALPWAVPALFRPGGVGGDPAGAAVFAPRADTPGGVVLSVLTGGGIWNRDVVPPGRDTLPSLLAALVIVAVAAVGAAVALRGPDLRRRSILAVVLPGLVAVAGVALLLLPGVARVVAQIPGGALLRDASRLLGPWLAGVAAGFGLAVDRLSAAGGVLEDGHGRGRDGGRDSGRDRGRDSGREGAGRKGPEGSRPGVAGHHREGVRPVQPVLAAVVALLPLAALPAVGWGLSGSLRPVDYPTDFPKVARRVDASPPGALVVLPFESYRAYRWNHQIPALDPVPRWTRQPAVGAADLVVRQAGTPVRVKGEDPFADRVAAALSGADPVAELAELGVRWVVVDVAGYRPPAGLTVAYAGPALRLYAVPGVGRAAAAPLASWSPPWPVVLAGDALAGALWVVVATRHPRREEPGRNTGLW
jgi:hypothetical protein